MKKLTATLAAAALGTLATVAAAGPSAAAPDTACQKAGLSGAGLIDDVARDGLPIATAGSLGVAPRATTNVAALPDPLPLSVILADHRAGSSSLFVYPWC